MGTTMYTGENKSTTEPVKINPTLSTMSPEAIKPSGMPFGLKIALIVILLGIGGYFLYTMVISKYFVKHTVVQTAPAPKPLFMEGQVAVAKCKDFKDIALYLESNITLEDYNTTLMAVSKFPSTLLTIPNQELTYKSPNGKIKVYKCQVVKDGKTGKNILMGKLVKM